MSECGRDMLEYDPVPGDVRTVPTVRVRIAVAVDAVGRYEAAGWGGGVGCPAPFQS